MMDTRQLQLPLKHAAGEGKSATKSTNDAADEVTNSHLLMPFALWMNETKRRKKVLNRDRQYQSQANANEE
jgi:hypothetical protein